MIGETFQRDFEHGVPSRKRVMGARISFTFRTSYAAEKVMKEGVEDEKETCRVENGRIVNGPSFDEIMAIVAPYLRSDKTQRFGKTFENHGRKSCEFLTWHNPEEFIYTYGQQKHIGQTMPEAVRIVADALTKANDNVPLDWAHVTFFTSGECTLGFHSDNETVIRENTNIWCWTLMQNTNETRDVVVRPKTPKKRKASQ